MKKEILFIALIFFANLMPAETAAESKKITVESTQDPQPISEALALSVSHKLHITKPQDLELDIDKLLADIFIIALDKYPKISEGGVQVLEEPSAIILLFDLPVPQSAQRAILDALIPIEAVFTDEETTLIPPSTTIPKKVSVPVSSNSKLSSKTTLHPTVLGGRKLQINIPSGANLDVDSMFNKIFSAFIPNHPEITWMPVIREYDTLVLIFNQPVPETIQRKVFEIVSPLKAIFTTPQQSSESAFTLKITIPPDNNLNINSLMLDIFKTAHLFEEFHGGHLTKKNNTFFLVFDKPISKIAQKAILNVISPLEAIFSVEDQYTLSGSRISQDDFEKKELQTSVKCNQVARPDENIALAAANKVLPSVVILNGGTGFIISSDGYIMTNAHNLRGKEKFEITLYDGRRLQGQKVGYVELKEGLDVGVIKIEANNLPTVEFADSTKLRCGDPLLIIGNPNGYDYWTITGGQFLMTDMDGADLVTNVPSTQGSSGSPLLNMEGQVVGLLWGTHDRFRKKEQPTPPIMVEVLWTWKAFHSLIIPTSSSVSIESALDLTEKIIHKQTNLISGFQVAQKICIPAGISTQITIPITIPGEVLLEPDLPYIRQAMDFLLPSFNPQVAMLDLQRVAGNVVLTFNQPLSPIMCEKLVATLLFSNAPSNPLPTLKRASISKKTTQHPQNTEALTAAKRALPSVVHFRNGGTGSIITSDGYILTNQHVVVDDFDQAITDFQITLYNERIFSGRLVGYVESGTPDIAVVKIEANNLPTIEFGDSSTLQKGQSLLTIGHPGVYGDWVVTGGKLLKIKKYNIFTNIPAGQGNSGGPIINLQGQMVALLYGGISTPIEKKPNPIHRIIWGFPEFYNLSRQQTTGVKSNTVKTIVDAIISRQGNVP